MSTPVLMVLSLDFRCLFIFATADVLTIIEFIYIDIVSVC